jgi:hypothetical protein
MYVLEIDGSQIDDLNIIMKNEIILFHHYIFNKHQIISKSKHFHVFTCVEYHRFTNVIHVIKND